jgi:hypothetical protein
MRCQGRLHNHPIFRDYRPLKYVYPSQLSLHLLCSIHEDWSHERKFCPTQLLITARR